MTQYIRFIDKTLPEGMEINKPTNGRTAGPYILDAPGHPITRKQVDPDALKIIDRLDREGFLACLVGGAVRDLMLGRKPKDFDIATDARPGQIKKRFPNAYIIGRRFRLVHVHCPGGKIIEVATFRRDPENVPGATNGDAPPDPAAIYGTPREDAFRRDITINALLYDAVLDAVIDYVGGLEDLKCRRIRMIGDPAERFAEDSVRLWRVVRHAARLRFTIEERTEAALRAQADLLAKASGSRMYEELNKDLAGDTLPIFDGLRRFGLLRIILGRAGRAFEEDDRRFSRLRGLFLAAEGSGSEAAAVPLVEKYALIFWCWLEDRIAALGRVDPGHFLHDEFSRLESGATIPKLVRADIVQILSIAGTMAAALRTGQMRWSLLRRSHYKQAERLFFLAVESRPAAAGESFETMFRRAFPRSTSIPPSRRRGRRRRPGSARNGGN